MRVYVVRHACAGRKEEWEGADVERPLDDVGRQQALALADELARQGAERLISSPTRRCVETLEPVAAAGSRPIEISHALGTSATTETLVDLVTDPSYDRAVLCTHGEVMRPLLDWLRRHDVRVVADRADDENLVAKGTGWLLEVHGDDPIALEHIAPMPMLKCSAHSAPVA